MSNFKPHPIEKLSRENIVAIFEKMGQLCKEKGQYFEIAVYGGSALMLSFDYRESTVDVDFIPLRGAASDISDMADVACKSLNFENYILRDDVQMFVSDVAKHKIFGEFPKGDGNLRVFTAQPKYIFAMKTMAMRNSLESHDMLDIWELIDKCGIKNIEHARLITQEYYPNQKLPKRNDLLMQDIFEAKRNGKKYSASLGW